MDLVYLIALGSFPFIVYIHGYFVSGKQIFSLEQPLSTDELHLHTPTNIAVDDLPIPADVILEEQEKRKEVLKQNKKEKEGYKKAVSLSEKVMVIGDIAKEKTLDEDIKEDRVEKPLKKVAQKPLAQKKTIQQAEKKTNQNILQKELKKDPYANFKLERTSSLLYQKPVASKKENLSLKEKRLVKAQFIGNKRLVIGKDNFVYIRNMEALNLEAVIVPKGTVMVGQVNVTDKVNIDIHTVEVTGKEYKTNIVVCDTYGSEGLIYTDVNETMKEASSELDDMIKMD